MGSHLRRATACFLVVATILLSGASSFTGAQVPEKGFSGIPSGYLPATAPSGGALLRPGVDEVPGSSEGITISSALFRDWMPKIPNLQLGFSYAWANRLRQTRWSADYILPLPLRPREVLVGEAHGEYMEFGTSPSWVPFLNNFWRQGPPGTHYRVDLSLGVAYRRMIGDDLLVGANTFYDTTRLFGIWRSSGSVGLEMAANGPGDSALDLTVNYYANVYQAYNSRGSVFPTFNIIDGLRTGRGNLDVEAGFSRPLLDRSVDLRLKLTGYQLDLGNQRKYGWQTGFDLTSADGLVRLSVEYGHDGVYGNYGQVGGYLNVGTRWENLLVGQNPFVMPAPVFKSPRNLARLLTQPVHRNWQKPFSVITNPQCEGTPEDRYFEFPADKTCFYSGGRAQCGAFIIANTVGGKWMTWYTDPYYPSTPTSPYDYHRDYEPMWECASAAYARAARGEVKAYIRDDFWNTSTVFWRTELPTLIANGNVTKIYVYSTKCVATGDWGYSACPGSYYWDPIPRATWK